MAAKSGGVTTFQNTHALRGDEWGGTCPRKSKRDCERTWRRKRHQRPSWRCHRRLCSTPPSSKTPQPQIQHTLLLERPPNLSPQCCRCDRRTPPPTKKPDKRSRCRASRPGAPEGAPAPRDRLASASLWCCTCLRHLSNHPPVCCPASSSDSSSASSSAPSSGGAGSAGRRQEPRQTTQTRVFQSLHERVTLPAVLLRAASS
mmetsp:Transcript_36974/g.103257  ORF Transcript_36974/g.103257 Transcript_36974/m.103257 type:complete len:202 (+) Transcript_36974:70-675(+)